MNIQLAAHILYNIGNPFGVLDAQNGEHRMAQVASHETAPDTETPRWAKPTAIIVPCDLGDEDKRVMVYDVWHGAAIVGSGNTHTEALAWAEANGYNVLPIFPC